MIVTLILVVCVIGEPCRDGRDVMPSQEPLSALGCLVEGQRLAAEWLEEHPKYQLRGWRCQSPGQDRPT